ncbi:UDP-2,4-diacetamido-2,4,6-trideoxy-beta-L-altropyranose hydrolase [Dyadobacter fanqingshengii]|uniref:UDP-2,4-diacetamido-2,4, 6-trideoxy-beta-L-altropyranose hydrolase n=1 Tax=Dyadobacter fanqingshengii TaxID=2906443 RepID=A0A9X1P8B8_9BACT|nr:UDP-2,4-diacetamido-2,4,6-trideoxy-beta-L-altropyranose hydrolase [Dyadobacter fanqingshengii]MCF0039103.1 UDP-2,4-diacetamido-2,4,6-trideoxy-beta-L-altropyranose hydrolase [Dyadobacter fanqingshengii]USJ34077.1 UDP-2,4-diacetamido-2,4,6-trideoxy-beta-L-altropyranose hydrolase [Dyadobacter fanqingshengii]
MISKLYIRTDGSSSIGLGHLVRCIALSKMLDDSFNIHFACKQIPDSIAVEIRDAGFALLILQNDNELLSVLTPEDMVVVDSYELESDYQQAIKKIGCQLICIDDLHEKPSYADLILNHTPCVSPQEYNAQPYTQFALGPSYALIRPAFLELAVKERVQVDSASVLICFGGSDSRNLTKVALSVVSTFSQFKNIAIVTGTAYSHQQSLDEILEQQDNVVHYHNISAEEMAQRMSEADLCIVPASGILTEALTSGAKIISGMYVDNQIFVFENYKRANAFISAENFSEENLFLAVKNYFSQEHVKGARLVDGQSGERINKLFQQLVKERDFHLRRVTIEDAELTYQWASDKKVRQYSLSQSTIQFDDHLAWLSRKWTDPKCIFYIALFCGKPVGSIRFDLNDGDAVISYLLDPDYHGQGLGAVMLKKGILSLGEASEDKIERLSGIVMPDNISSCRTFERFGFEREHDGENYKYTMNIHDENRNI